jgi:hypothetical protein
MAAKGFGGRPRREPEPGERVSLGLRVTPDMKRRLDEAAAKSGRSQSQEAELRLERSFDYEKGLIIRHGEVWSPVLLNPRTCELTLHVGGDLKEPVVTLKVSRKDLARFLEYFEEPKK